MRPVRALALSPVPEEGAGCRFRVSQYIPYLEARGIRVTVRPFFTPEFFRIVYQTGAHFRKSYLFALQTLARLRLLAQRTDYDLFFVYREAFPIGPPVIELALSRVKGRALVYDFDDAIFLTNSSDANKLVGILKYPQKVSQIIRGSARVVAGNTYLADYARRYNEAVIVIPTCVDTTKFVPRPGRHGDNREGRPTVGWIGSHSTAKYLRSLLPVLERVAGRHRFQLYVVGSLAPLHARGFEVTQAQWDLEREVEDFRCCDVGVYPLWDDDWSRGKCGFKAIQFMACGVPVVASAVGVNREIIQDGVNGFLAATEEDWMEKLGWLLSDSSLREKLGRAGRETIVERYSLAVHAPTMATVFRSALEAA
ncbi:MAG: glycosyltransferase family 4 protein [candidate division NC10 bacterium]|nr:glycosyltransferase family 4 protein [candidate division NC10 bacterium]